VADQPVTAPDQHKPGFGKSARIGAYISMVILLLMLIGNHEGNVENLWVLGSVIALGTLLLGDWALRRNGLRR
jgi:hypothetical protein